MNRSGEARTFHCPVKKYGKTIYGTRGGPWKPGKSIASTRKGNTIFVHLLNYSGETVTLPNIARKIIASSMLTGGTAQVRQAAQTISIRIKPLAARPPDHGAEWLLPPKPGRSLPPQIDSILKLELDGSAMDLEPL